MPKGFRTHKAHYVSNNYYFFKTYTQSITYLEAKEKINHVQNQDKVVYVLPMASLILSFHIRKKESLTILTKHVLYNFLLVKFIEKYHLPLIVIQIYFLAARKRT